MSLILYSTMMGSSFDIDSTTLEAKGVALEKEVEVGAAQT